jgi:hypothetical protein
MTAAVCAVDCCCLSTCEQLAEPLPACGVMTRAQARDAWIAMHVQLPAGGVLCGRMLLCNTWLCELFVVLAHAWPVHQAASSSSQAPKTCVHVPHSGLD